MTQQRQTNSKPTVTVNRRPSASAPAVATPTPTERDSSDSDLLTADDLQRLEQFADKIFASVGIDVNFTKHFLDRANDIRNKKQITFAELAILFKKELLQWGRPIADLGNNSEAIMTDRSSSINIPFVLKWDAINREFDLIAKTVMRKPKFVSNNNEPVFPVESITQKLSNLQLSETQCTSVSPGCVFKAAGQKFPVYIVTSVDGSVCNVTVHLSDKQQREKKLLCKQLLDRTKVDFFGTLHEDIRDASGFTASHYAGASSQADANDSMYHSKHSSRRYYTGSMGAVVKNVKRLTKIANDLKTNELIQSAPKSQLMHIRSALASVVAALDNAFTSNDKEKMHTVTESIKLIERTVARASTRRK